MPWVQVGQLRGAELVECAFRGIVTAISRDGDRCGDAAWVRVDVTSNGHAFREIAVTMPRNTHP